MTTPESQGASPTATVDEAPGPETQTDWWHRDHPTFTALAGYFAGMLFVTVVPGGFAGILRLLFRFDTAERLFPLVAVFLAVPIGLVVATRTRRFGKYMFLGMAITTAVVLGVASLVLYFLVRYDV